MTRSLSNIRAQLIIIVLCAVIQSVQAQDIVVEEEVGTATLDDSFHRQGTGQADFYFASHINGVEIENAIGLSTFDGSSLFPSGASREVPASPILVEIHAIVVKRSFLNLFHRESSRSNVSGLVEFVPQAGQKYVVKGELRDTHSAVWIEDLHGNPVTEPVLWLNSEVDFETGAGKGMLSKLTETGKTLTVDEQFLSLSGGESADLVEAKLGPPDLVKNYKPNFFTARTHRPHVAYYYKGLGEIRFSVKGRSKEPQYIETIYPDIGQDTNIMSLSYIMEDIDPIVLREVARKHFIAEEKDPAVLDVFAEKLWRERFVETGVMADTMAWFCKVIGQSGNPRYRLVMEQVLRDANAKKVRRYAEGNLELLPVDDTVEQFDPSLSQGPAEQDEIA